MKSRLECKKCDTGLVFVEETRAHTKAGEEFFFYEQMKCGLIFLGDLPVVALVEI